jgi:hypothetical protein
VTAFISVSELYPTQNIYCDKPTTLPYPDTTANRRELLGSQSEALLFNFELLAKASLVFAVNPSHHFSL